MELKDIIERAEKLGAHALARYGHDSQRWMMVEEASELTQAMAQHRRGRVPCALVIEEVADVLIMAIQMGQVFGIEDELAIAVSVKLDRLERRLGTVQP